MLTVELWNRFCFKGESSVLVKPVNITEKAMQQALEIRRQPLPFHDKQWLLSELKKGTCAGQSKALALAILNQPVYHDFPLASLLYQIEELLDEPITDIETRSLNKHTLMTHLFCKTTCLIRMTNQKVSHCLLFSHSPHPLFFNSTSRRIYHFKDSSALFHSFFHHIRAIHPWALKQDACWYISHLT